MIAFWVLGLIVIARIIRKFRVRLNVNITTKGRVKLALHFLFQGYWWVLVVEGAITVIDTEPGIVPSL
jgi:hypothetical protein